MLTLVLILNALISLACLFVAWKLWNLRRVLGRVADVLLACERSTYRVLHGAPGAIAKAERGTNAARRGYQQLEAKLDAQLQQVERVIRLLRVGQWLWLRSRRGRFSRKVAKVTQPQDQTRPIPTASEYSTGYQPDL